MPGPQNGRVNSGEARASRVLVVRAGALGDTLMVTPLIRQLHASAPGREVDLLCSGGGAALLRTNPYLSQTHALHLRNIPYFLSPEKRRLVRTIHEREYEFAVLLESASRYRELLEKAGIRDIRSFDQTPFDPKQHAIVNNLRAAGFSDLSREDLEMDLPVPEPDLAWARTKLSALPKPWIGIHPGYGPAGKKQNQTERLRGWASNNFIEVAKGLTGGGGSVILTGSAGDIETCEAIAGALPRDRVFVSAGQTNIQQMIGMIKSLNLYVSVDSGPAHMAAAVGTPLVVLWGPGIFDQTRPMSSVTPIQILNAGVPCAPCYGTPMMKTCRRNICMEAIHPDAVISAGLMLMGKPDRSEAKPDGAFRIV